MFITGTDLKVGDILLGYSGSTLNKGDEHLSSGYVHAALYIGDSLVVEASGTRVKKISLNDICMEYNHISVIRQSEAWNKKNIIKMHEFINKRISNNAKFNVKGLREFKKNSDNAVALEYENLRKYFEDGLKPDSIEKDSYFCSELIVSIYIYIDYISESASIIYSPEKISPEFLGKDATFGHFKGYIKPYDSYKIPKGDLFEYS